MGYSELRHSELQLEEIWYPLRVVPSRVDLSASACQCARGVDDRPTEDASMPACVWLS